MARELKATVTDKGIRIYIDDKRKSSASEFGCIQRTDTVCNALIAANPRWIIEEIENATNESR